MARAKAAPVWDKLVNMVRDDRNGGGISQTAEQAAILGMTLSKKGAGFDGSGVRCCHGIRYHCESSVVSCH